MKNIVIWLFTKEELVCVKQDAEHIINERRGLYTSRIKNAAKSALHWLDKRIGQIEAREGPIVWPK